MILICIGSNMPYQDHQSPLAVCKAAMVVLAASGITVVQQSPWYRTAPVPANTQPWFINGVAELTTDLPPGELLAHLHTIEDRFGRQRQEDNPNASRTLDLDLLDYNGQVISEEDGLQLPHPRLHKRAFVLKPLVDIAPKWRHPVSGLTVEELLNTLPEGQEVEREFPFSE